ncbi:thiamine diphosphokinase [Streptococcus entericus]|uniref:thiamine diphosphokinase n=1 Tax=Streptococcus entericus TaxID=155680 RepID=UPI0003621934|nr:thiamine diphosphokinase [Streptococcus entericus]
MPRIALCLGGQPTLVPRTFDAYVGVDRACLFLLEHGLALDMAVGDFDSVTAEELATIKHHALILHQAPAEKNDTDAELALKLIFAQYPTAEVTIFGAFGGRLDHELSNLFLPSDPELAPYMQQLVLVDDLNRVQFFPAGSHEVTQAEGMTYLAFMASGEGQFTIQGAKYEMTRSTFFQKKVYSSNEFLGQPVRFSLDEGYAVVIQSRDRRA